MYYQLAYTYVYYMCTCLSSSRRPCKAPWNLTTISRVVNVLQMSGREKLQSLKGSKACSQLCGNSVFGLHYAGLLRRFTRVMQRNVECEQRKYKTTSGRGKWERNSFRRPLESSNSSMLTRKLPRNVDVGLDSTTWNFALLTTLCRACNAKATMTLWTRGNPRVNIE